MNLTAVTMVKDEADVIARTIEHLFAQGVDQIIVYENGSTDGTWEILRDLRDGSLAGRLEVYADEEVGYYQSRKMSALAVAAFASGADWIVPFDADELWTARIGGEARYPLRWLFEHVAEPAGAGVVPFQNFNHYRTALDPGGHPYDAMRYRSRDPLPLPKVAFRACASARLEMGNHGVSGVPGPVLWENPGRIHHFPYRSAEQFIRKARNGSAAYAATDLPRSTGQHWREWGEALERGGEDALREWYRAAFTYEDPIAAELVLDPVR